MKIASVFLLAVFGACVVLFCTHTVTANPNDRELVKTKMRRHMYEATRPRRLNTRNGRILRGRRLIVGDERNWDNQDALMEEDLSGDALVGYDCSYLRRNALASCLRDCSRSFSIRGKPYCRTRCYERAARMVCNTK